MQNLEIVSFDDDVRELTAQYWDAGTLYLTQIDTDGIKASILLHPREAKQLIAALSAFIDGKFNHTADCALHNSPAYPIEACNCAPECGEDGIQ